MKEQVQPLSTRVVNGSFLTLAMVTGSSNCRRGADNGTAAKADTTGVRMLEASRHRALLQNTAPFSRFPSRWIRRE